MADWKPPPVPSDAVHLKLRCAKGWAGKCSSLEERTVALGATIPWENWASLDGFHERMPPALDAQYVEHREAEVASGLRQGVYGLPPSQDPKVLV